MRNSIIGVILLFFMVNSIYAQQIQVLNEESHEPLASVALYNAEKSKSVLTNFDGVANISLFDKDEVIHFKHVNFTDKSLRKSQIIQNKVYLKSDGNELDQVVLSVAKFEMNKDEIPQKIVSFSANDIIMASPQTSADLLESSGQVFVQKSQLGGGSPMIRGFATNRLLITVDGVRMNTAIFRSGNLQNIISIDPLAVENTEVILGPGSVVYGSDAIGGVMNFYTLKPKFSFTHKASVSGSVYSRYASANNEKTIHADVNIGLENWAFLSSISFSDFDDLRMGSHGPDEYLRNEYAVRRNGEDVIVPNDNPQVQKPTGYQQVNLLQKVKFMPHKDWDLNLGLIYSTTSDFPRFDRLYRKRDGDLRTAEWYYGPQEWFMGNFKINKKGSGALYDKAQMTTAYQFFEESRHNRDFGEDWLYNTKENVDAYSVNFDFEKTFEESRLFYGAEYVFNKVNSTGFAENILTEEENITASRYPDGSTWQSIAAYTTYQWKIQEDLSFQSGLRYNHILVDAEFDENLYDFPFSEANINTGALTGSAGINWQQNRFIGWRLNLSTAFRAPNIDDVGKIFDSEPGAVVVPNPDLKPEYAYSSELGFDWKPAENISFIATAFYTYLNDAMVRRDFNLNGETEIDYQGEQSRVQAIQNTAKAHVYGFESGIEIDFSVALRLTSQISITEGKEEQEDGSTAALRHAAPVFGNTHLIWHKKRLKFDLFAEYNGQFDYEDLAPSEQGKAYLYAIDNNGNPYSPSWYSLNLTGQYEFSKNLLATASLENITDQRYRTYSSGIAAAGRNLILALRYSF
ncbi:TonB-dependent receptor [Salegentibacter salarius]|uniref:TonB-dependent receptor n=1 Tax=Salegentibacter salarius TaxID=435906 RepID=A0A2N0U228_9FLAO|nr:TonB-dependent receptor [Salegentibacter salarius]OEY73725.1 TonB-dependent receptor [Salegentibacter salarius]PKD21039.1 TonB-dependent receptor [Salegentibacter salarius]SLJ94302.1 hemoglobin/transferrin/lactoferrin receptor protein [Salegentibacter salarius]